MLYALLFSLLAAYLVVIAVAVNGFAWVLLWPALSFSLFASAYAFHSPGVLGKRRDGRVAWWAWPTLGPVLGLLSALWHLQLWVRREAVCHEVAAGVWLGRRPRYGEIPAGVRLVVDLTAEFAKAPGVGMGHEYACLPTLDGLAPGAVEVEAILAKIEACGGPVYVHCALGHGRSALVAAAVLLRRGIVGDIRAAELHLRERRPGVRLKGAQRRLLARLFDSRLHDDDGA